MPKSKVINRKKLVAFVLPIIRKEKLPDIVNIIFQWPRDRQEVMDLTQKQFSDLMNGLSIVSTIRTVQPNILPHCLHYEYEVCKRHSTLEAYFAWVKAQDPLQIGSKKTREGLVYSLNQEKQLRMPWPNLGQRGLTLMLQRIHPHLIRKRLLTRQHMLTLDITVDH